MSSAGECPGKVWEAEVSFTGEGGSPYTPFRRAQKASPHSVVAGGGPVPLCGDDEGGAPRRDRALRSPSCVPPPPASTSPRGEAGCRGDRGSVGGCSPFPGVRCGRPASPGLGAGLCGSVRAPAGRGLKPGSSAHPSRCTASVVLACPAERRDFVAGGGAGHFAVGLSRRRVKAAGSLRRVFW